jgi:ATP-dependent RNA helicase DDX24/MAK5
MHSSNLLIKGSGIKRKQETGRPLSRKKAKSRHLTINDLPWKSVSRPSDTGLGGDDGILELEEVEGVEVVYEDTDVGRVVKFNVSRCIVLLQSGDFSTG